MRSHAHRDSPRCHLSSLLVWAVAVMLLSAAPATSSAADDEIFWEDLRSKEGSLRRATFLVADAACGYQVMAEPRTMGTLLRHVNKLVVHSIQGHFQDVSVHERFFLVGNVESRYHRMVNGSDRLEWRLVSGRQARHDGTWVVEAREDGSAEVTFENLIKAKYAIHQGLLRRIQDRTMSDIVDAVRERCGEGAGVEPGRSETTSAESLDKEPGSRGHQVSTSDKDGAAAAGAQSR